AAMPATSDVFDQHPTEALVCLTAFRQFGGVREFSGRISTVRCDGDNVLVKQQVGEPGEGRVLVIDGGGSGRVALLGDKVAGLAKDSGWSGIIVKGCVRDVAALAEMELGIKALGTCPRPSGKSGEGEIDQPVTFGEVTFRPGAMLYSDDDGIVVLPEAAV
ncbi:MAG: regulator of ribonuclease, partial [Actinomycetota bacterium]|nr:regulator of ribonuclease [Actinomycetota bacterium]